MDVVSRMSSGESYISRAVITPLKKSDNPGSGCPSGTVSTGIGPAQLPFDHTYDVAPCQGFRPPIVLTERGLASVAAALEVIVGLEAELAKLLGADALAKLHASLGKIVARSGASEDR